MCEVRIMDVQKTEKYLQNEKITVWDLMYIVKPIIAEELIAKLRFDRRE